MNEQQYYSPIIQAMIASAQHMQGQQQLQQAGNIAKANEQARQTQLAQEEEKIRNEHEYQSGQLGVLQDQLKATLESNRLANIKSLRDLSTSGVGQPTLASIAPSGVDVNGLPGPEQEAQRIQGLAQAQAQGTANVTQPFQEQMQQNQFTHESNAAMMANSNALDMQRHQQAFLTSMKGMEQSWESGEKQLDRSTHMKIAQMDNSGRMAIAQLPYNPPPGALGTMIVAGLNGAPLSPDHPADRAALTQMYQNGWHPVAKGDIEALKASQTMIPLMNQLEDVVNKMPTSTTGAFLQNLGQKAAGAVGVKTNLQTKLDEMNTNLINVGKTIEGLTGGRVTNRLIGLSEGGLITPGMTKDQALDKVRNLKDMISNKMDNIILGGEPDDAKNIIYRMNGIKPSWLLTAPKTHPTQPGFTLDEDASMKANHPVYSK